MTARACARVAVATVIAALVATASASPAGAEPNDLIDLLPAVVTVQVPDPGHTSTWTMRATNVTDDAIDLALEISGRDGTVFSGPHPLRVTLTDAAGTVLETDDLGATLGRVVELPPLASGASYEVDGVATLPREAGNEYATADGDLLVRFVAEESPSPAGAASGPLASTGLDAAALALGAGELVVLGGLLLAARTRRNRHA